MSPFSFSDGEIAVGQHDVKIVDVGEGTSENKGTPYIALELEDAAGRTLSERLYLTPAAMWKIRELWEAAGLEWGAAGDQADESELVGLTVHVDVVDEPYGDRVYRRVHEWSAAVGSDIPTDVGRPVRDPAGDDPIPF